MPRVPLAVLRLAQSDLADKPATKLSETESAAAVAANIANPNP